MSDAPSETIVAAPQEDIPASEAMDASDSSAPAEVAPAEQIEAAPTKPTEPEMLSVSNGDKRVERVLRDFVPSDFGLGDGFLLTNYTKKKGCGCKVPRDTLLELLKAFGEHSPIENGAVGIGLDSCVVPLRHKGLNLVQTTDFFYPLIDDPYIMGRITCANVLSDLYAMGVTDCDNMLMLLGVSVDFDAKSRDIVLKMFMEGFKDAADIAGTKVRGGQTVTCPWLLLGGVATSVVLDTEVIQVDRAERGNVLVLTKPIGGQVAVNSSEWLLTKNGRIQELALDEFKIKRAFKQAKEQMSRLNRNAARLLHKYGATGSTDVTGFGILGHADNLARAQQNPVHFVIDVLPIIEYMDEIARKMPNGNGFNLFGGTSAETSGGLLVVLPEENAQRYIDEIKELDSCPAWIIGRVEKAADDCRKAIISKNYCVISVPSPLE